MSKVKPIENEEDLRRLIKEILADREDLRFSGRPWMPLPLERHGSEDRATGPPAAHPPLAQETVGE